MSKSFFNPAVESSANNKFREKRFQFFLSQLLKIDKGQPITILDIGGTEIFWERMNFTNRPNVRITLLNLEKVNTHFPGFVSIKGDACDLHDINDKAFDIVFSNSVIEHLFNFENQQKMANEAMRVGKYYYIQTPNFYFPIEPHWMFPFFQVLPFSLKVFLTRNFNMGHYNKIPDQKEAEKQVNEVKLLTRAQMARLFPNGKMFLEKFLGLNKSITMYHFPDEKLTSQAN
ncbi:MAG TPA: methyltransferase domain-containing protein [Flavihumibacter sp.]|nr:class I SAM-dependent methyltransferase [Bacteroidota bacterium]HOA37201.1 methyltransferase domain-containing protein [Flavihumibacter sp.]HQD10928.1 methyltransferase domain-containing protein [Flavihumibacter sp.]